MSSVGLMVRCLEIRDRARSAIGRFVRNERGDAVQNVMVVAVAVVLLGLLLLFGRTLYDTKIKPFIDGLK